MDEEDNISKDVQINILKILPSIITLTAFCCGVTAIRVAINGHLTSAVFLLFVSGIMDMLDGKIARLLGHSTKIGAELDSLSDLVCFGVAPGLIVYIFALKDIPRLGWAVSLFYIICCAFRLAKFNVMADEDTSDPDGYFSGIPAPAGAAFALLPMQLFAATHDMIFLNKYFIAVIALSSALCMIGRFKAFSSKQIKIHKANAMKYMLCISIIFVGLMSSFWYTVSMLTISYVASLFVCNRDIWF